MKNRWLPLLLTLLILPALTACEPTEEDPTESTTAYEIWALDQGTNLLYIYDDRRELSETVDLGAKGIITPHMISFSQNHDYAVIASTGSGDVAILRTEDREILEIIPTGPRTHMASFTLDDSRIIVDVIGSPDVFRDGTILEIDVDLSMETFTVGRSLVLAEDPLIANNFENFRDTAPICHEYNGQGQALITLGPGLADGGLVVLDIEDFELVHALGPEEIQANCGTVPTADRRKMILTGGSEEIGVWYVIDTETFEIIKEEDTGGLDAHGVWLTPDGSEFWLVNRFSKDGIIIDATTFEITETIPDVGGTPDILAMGPTGEYAYISLRGPNPKSGAHLAIGDNPGFSVIDLRTRQLVEVIEPDRGNGLSDFHGIAVRSLID